MSVNNALLESNFAKLSGLLISSCAFIADRKRPLNRAVAPQVDAIGRNAGCDDKCFEEGARYPLTLKRRSFSTVPKELELARLGSAHDLALHPKSSVRSNGNACGYRRSSNKGGQCWEARHVAL